MTKARIATLVTVIVGLTLGMVAAAQAEDAAALDRARKAELLLLDPGRATPGQLPGGTVYGPPGRAIACNGPAEPFDSGIPGDWGVVNNAGGPAWTNVAGSGEAGNFTNGTGDCASVSSDAFGEAEFDTELRSPPFTTTGQGLVSLHYTVNYQNFANYDFLDVDVSTDGGSSWTNALRWNEDHGAFRAQPGVDVVLDLSATAANQASVIVRWHYYDPNANDYDWYAQVDNVSLVCAVPVELQHFTAE